MIDRSSSSPDNQITQSPVDPAAAGRPRSRAVQSRRQAVAFLFFVALCFGAAGIGGAITSSSVGTWYQTLAKPSWTPPDWVFGPVWTALYFMMAVAAWLVWRRQRLAAARAALGWFGLQLALNVGWSALFFGLRSPGLAFLDIVLLWFSIAVTAVLFTASISDRRLVACAVPSLDFVRRGTESRGLEDELMTPR